MVQHHSNVSYCDSAVLYHFSHNRSLIHWREESCLWVSITYVARLKEISMMSFQLCYKTMLFLKCLCSSYLKLAKFGLAWFLKKKIKVLKHFIGNKIITFLFSKISRLLKQIRDLRFISENLGCRLYNKISRVLILKNKSKNSITVS